MNHHFNVKKLPVIIIYVELVPNLDFFVLQSDTFNGFLDSV